MADDLPEIMAPSRRLDRCLTPAEVDPGVWFAEPRAVALCDGPYLDRLAVLQRWRVFAASHEKTALSSEIEDAVRLLKVSVC